MDTPHTKCTKKKNSVITLTIPVRCVLNSPLRNSFGSIIIIWIKKSVRKTKQFNWISYAQSVMELKKNESVLIMPRDLSRLPEYQPYSTAVLNSITYYIVTKRLGRR